MSEFDLEWAKRGGVFVYKTVVDPIWTAKLIGVHKSGMLNIVFTTDLSTERCFKDDLRMATLAECDAAGVEYIEPPVSAEELEELREEIERLKEAEIESDFVREKLATLLAEIAIAVKGLPNELQAHDLSDLPEICRELREDKEMLEWMFSPDIFRVVTTDRTYDGTFKSFEVSEVSDLSYSYFDTLSIGSTPREAIRAAMKGGAS